MRLHITNSLHGLEKIQGLTISDIQDSLMPADTASAADKNFTEAYRQRKRLDLLAKIHGSKSGILAHAVQRPLDSVGLKLISLPSATTTGAQVQFEEPTQSSAHRTYEGQAIIELQDAIVIEVSLLDYKTSDINGRRNVLEPIFSEAERQPLITGQSSPVSLPRK